MAHALAASTGGSLDEEGVADLCRSNLSLLKVSCRPAWNERDVGSGCQLSGLDFRTHASNGTCGRTDVRESCSRASFGKLCVLGQESVAGDECIGTTLLCRSQQVLGVEVARSYVACAQRYCMV